MTTAALFRSGFFRPLRASAALLAAILRLTRHGWLRGSLVAVLAVCALCVAYVDRPVATAVFALHGTWVREVYVVLSELGEGWAWYAAAGLALAGAAVGRLVVHRAGPQALLWRVQYAAGFMIAAMLASGITVPVLKVLVGRLRPKFLYYHGLYDFAPLTFRMGDVCFPSGHTQTIVAALAALALIFPGRTMTAFCLFTATLVGGSRIVLGAHFVADVVMGAYVGLAGTVLVHRYFQSRGWPVRITSRHTSR